TRFPPKNIQYLEIPCLEFATSILRKYFSFSNSFISNCVASFSFRVSFSISSSPITIISSTKTKRSVSMKEDVFNIKLLQVLAKVYDQGFPSKVDPFVELVDPFVELVDPFVKPFPITMADLVLELPLSSMIDH
ncbi:hypothetical protein CR513_06846, partial [Mucuna pruriens]